MGDEGSIDPTPLKRARTGDLKRVAEIVMVLSAMGGMRAGKDPTAVEKALAAEARRRLVGVCEKELKPKDLIPREAVRVVVEDLGLNRSRDPMMGFRPSKMSIAEKLLLTKRKMEDSKTFTPHSSAHTSQHSPVDSHGTSMHGTPKFIPDRQSPVTFSSGGFQSVTPGVHAHSITSITPSLKQSHNFGDTHLTPTSLKPSTSLEKDTPLLAHQHAGTPHRFATSAEKTPSTPSVQSTSAAFVTPGQQKSLLDHPQGISVGVHEVSNAQADDQVASSQEAKISEAHGAEAAQGAFLVHGPSFFTNHEDIFKSVQKILQPKVFDHPNWNPPSAEYTNKPLNCQICKITITDVESVLVCDACEKGTHLKCLQSFGNKEGIPKAEWHCPRCLITSNGKPFPPKYGRVTRTIAPQKAPSNTAATSSSSDKKPEILAAKVNQQKPVTNGNSGLPHLGHASSSSTNSSGFTGDLKAAHAVAIQSGIKKEEELSTVSATNNSTVLAGVVCATASAESESSVKDVKHSGELTVDKERSTFDSVRDQKAKSELSCPETPRDTPIETANQSQTPNKSNEVKAPISVEVAANQGQEFVSTGHDDLKEQSKLQGKSEPMIGCDIRLDGRGSSLEAHNGNHNISDSRKPLELQETSEANSDALLDYKDKSEITENGAIENDRSKDCEKPAVTESDDVLDCSKPSVLKSDAVEGCSKPSAPESDAAESCSKPSAPELDAVQDCSKPLVPVADAVQDCGKPLVPESDAVQGRSKPSVPESDAVQDCSKPSVPESDAIQWLGDIVEIIEEKTYYHSCRINGISLELQNHILVSSSRQKCIPSKLQSLWEDNKTGTKWAFVNQYYFPSDLPEVSSRPSTLENNEVYASKKEITIMASSISGPCDVLSMQRFKEEIDRRAHLTDASRVLHPVFVCRWMYDESKGVFQSITD